MPKSSLHRSAAFARSATQAASILLVSTLFPVAAATLSVGPGKTYATPCQALTRAVSGDTVEIEGGTTYTGDVCGFYAHNLTIRGVNGRPKIDAGGKYSMGKGIWVVAGNGTTIENVEMYGAKVPDRNGAALRLDGMHLTLRNSNLHHNENGILTNNDGVSNIVIENTEFGFNGHGDGYSHNVYVGRVASLVFNGNFSHNANVGHNLKSRASTNTIGYNRFSSTTNAPSYEIDLPNAGTSYIVGNVIHQPANVNNPGLVTFGVEGATNAGKDLYVVNNTFINDRSSGGTFLFIGSGVNVPVVARNNLVVGTGTFSTQGSTIDHNNHKVASYSFVNRASFDLRPAAGSYAIDNGVDAGVSASGLSLAPTTEHLHGALSRPRKVVGKVDIGAYESTSAPLTQTEPVAPSTPPTSPPATPGADDVWALCAKEAGVCKVPSDRIVRYGAQGKYAHKWVKGQIACTNAAFGDPIYGVVKTCEFDNTTSSEPKWKVCAPENGLCTVAGTKQVRYGVSDRFFFKTVTGSVKCDNATFGDPYKNHVKSCEVMAD